MFVFENVLIFFNLTFTYVTRQILARKTFMRCSIASSDLGIGIVPVRIVSSRGTWALLPPAFERVVPDEQRHSLVLREDYQARY